MLARADLQTIQAPLVFLDHPGWIGEDTTDLVPDRGVQLLDGYHAGIAPALPIEPPSIRPCASIVVIVLLALRLVEPLVGTTESIPALAADEQPLKQILCTAAMLPDPDSTFSKLLLNRFEQVSIDDRWHGNRYAVLERNFNLAAGMFGEVAASMGRAQGRLPGEDPSLSEGGLADVGGVRQQVPDGAAAPAGQPGRAGNTHLEQAAANRAQRDVLSTDPLEDRTNHLGLVLGHVETGDTISRFPTDIAVAERRAGHDTENAGSRQVAFAPAASLQHLGALVLGKHALQLKQQVIFRRLANGSVEEDDLRAGMGEFLDENGLIGVVAGEAIGSVDIEPVDDRHRGQVT